MHDLPSKIRDIQETDTYAVDVYLREVRQKQPVELITTTDTHVIIETESFIGRHKIKESIDENTVHAHRKGTYEVKHDTITTTFTCRTLPESLSDKTKHTITESENTPLEQSRETTYTQPSNTEPETLTTERSVGPSMKIPSQSTVMNRLSRILTTIFTS